MIALKPDLELKGPAEAGSAAAPTQKDAEAAVRLLIRWAGDDPSREGLLDTPARVARAYKEQFAGYQEDPRVHLERTFEEVAGYQEMIVLRDIRLVSTCEHHMLPVVGVAHVGYVPRRRVVGISKLSRVVKGFASRLQIQEKLTAEILAAIEEVLDPLGAGVSIQAQHSCMTLRGVNQAGSILSTCRLSGRLRDDPQLRAEFLGVAAQSGPRRV